MSVRGTRIPPHLQLPIAGVTPPPTEKEGQRLFPTGNFRFYRPVYRDKTPPCNNACPTGEQIQKYLDYVKHERYLDGYVTILEDNPSLRHYTVGEMWRTPQSKWVGIQYALYVGCSLFGVAFYVPFA